MLCRLITNPSYMLLRKFMNLNCVIIFSVFISVDTYPFITTDSVLPNEDHESPDQVWIVVEQDFHGLHSNAYPKGQLISKCPLKRGLNGKSFTQNACWAIEILEASQFPPYLASKKVAE